MRVVLDAHPDVASVRGEKGGKGEDGTSFCDGVEPGLDALHDGQELMLRRCQGEKNGLAQFVQKGRMPPSLSFCKSEQLCTKGLAQGEIATVVSTPRNATPYPRSRTFSSDLAIAKE